MYVPRASILRRPAKTGAGKANDEQAPVEWAKEQRRLDAKTARATATEERLVSAYYATPEERRQGWCQVQREAEQLAAARAASRAAEAQREAAWLAQPQQVVIDTERPWSAASSTYYMPPQVEEAARRRGQQQASDFNRLTAQRRAAHEAQQHAAEQDALRKDYEAEETWFNRGAANQRWIPPERRIKQRAAIPAQCAPQPPPYYCDADDAGSSAATAAPAFAAQRPASASRRAQEGQGVAAAMRQDAAPAVGSSLPSARAAPAVTLAGGSSAQGQPQVAAAQPLRQFPWSWAA